MRYVVKNPENKMLILNIVSSIPVLPEGWEILGLEESINPGALDLERASWDGLTLVEDTDKILAIRQAKANANLDSIRTLREPLLKEADIEINKKEDASEDSAALRVWRSALRTCTDTLKKVNGDAKLTCENLIPEEFEFPVKP